MKVSLRVTTFPRDVWITLAQLRTTYICGSTAFIGSLPLKPDPFRTIRVSIFSHGFPAVRARRYSSVRSLAPPTAARQMLEHGPAADRRA